MCAVFDTRHMKVFGSSMKLDLMLRIWSVRISLCSLTTANLSIDGRSGEALEQIQFAYAGIAFSEISLFEASRTLGANKLDYFTTR